MPRFRLQLLSAFIAAVTAAALAAPVSGYRVLTTYPHSTQSYTEGFFYLNGLFYEGTGLEGRSAILVSDPSSGRVLQTAPLDARYFGEGIVDFGPNLYQWTWQSHTGFVYDRFSLRLLRRFTYEGEGWGMTHNGAEIITSDGSATLTFRDPASFGTRRKIIVHDGPTAITQLNELEYIHGEIFANIWHSDRIARISPRDGRVLGWIDLSHLLPENEKLNAESVLNGIAYDAVKERIFVTGKNWPRIYEIEITNAGK